MRHRPHHPPYHHHVIAPLPRVRHLSRGVHFGLGIVGLCFVAMVAYWIRAGGMG
jgi:hypothetical protein